MTRLLLMVLAVGLVLAFAGNAAASDCCCCWLFNLHKDRCPPYRLMPSPTTLKYTPTPCCVPYQGPEPAPRFCIPFPEQCWAKQKLHPTCCVKPGKCK